ncbi:HAMP domain-containing sensor histidine kinase [bacterium]|nr:MAG: HAMP domain-containing sensor histidine kinase [bacterium]
MKLNWPKKILLYSITLTSFAVLLTAVITVKTATHLWETEFRERNTAYSLYTSLEVLRTFGGNFDGTVNPQAAESIAALTVNNEDLMGVMILTESGRVLFSTFEDSLGTGLEKTRTRELGEVVADVINTGIPITAELDTPDRRLLDVLAPVFTQGGSRPIAVRYVYGYGSLEVKTANLVKRVVIGAIILLCLGGLLSVFLSRGLVRPVRVLTESALRIAEGDREHRIKLETGDEMEDLARQFNRMVESLREQQADLERANIELTEANRQLTELQSQLLRSERLAALGQLSAGVSHELDNPVGVILGYAELIRDEVQTGSPLDEYASVILNETKRCKRIIAGLLDFSRPSQGDRQVLDPGVLIRETVAQLTEQRPFRRIKWNLVLGDEVRRIEADPDALRQVLVNLALNSAQAMTDEGEITVDLTTFRSRDQDGYLIRFTDTGPGVGEDALEKVFDPFYTTKGKGEGTGLGLSICRKLTEECGGWIRAAGGSVFEIWLPGAASVSEADVETR